MTAIDPIVRELDKLARLLENNSYAVEVDYAGASITVWAEIWPLQIRLSRSINHLKPSSSDEDEKG